MNPLIGHTDSRLVFLEITTYRASSPCLLPMGSTGWGIQSNISGLDLSLPPFPVASGMAQRQLKASLPKLDLLSFPLNCCASCVSIWMIRESLPLLRTRLQCWFFLKLSWTFSELLHSFLSARMSLMSSPSPARVTLCRDVCPHGEVVSQTVSFLREETVS